MFWVLSFFIAVRPSYCCLPSGSIMLVSLYILLASGVCYLVIEITWRGNGRNFAQHGSNVQRRIAT